MTNRLNNLEKQIRLMVKETCNNIKVANSLISRADSHSKLSAFNEVLDLIDLIKNEEENKMPEEETQEKQEEAQEEETQEDKEKENQENTDDPKEEGEEEAEEE